MDLSIMPLTMTSIRSVCVWWLFAKDVSDITTARNPSDGLQLTTVKGVSYASHGRAKAVVLTFP